MTEKEHPFTPGTDVIVQRDYSHYGKGTFTLDKVLKLHKTGRFTLVSEPSQQWYANKGHLDKANEWFGYKTRGSGGWGYSIYSTRLRLADEAGKKEFVEAQEERAHAKRCELIKAAASMPHSLSRELAKTILTMIEENAPDQQAGKP